MQESNGKSAAGTYRAGRVELDAPVDWPDGARVSIEPKEESLGLSESDWPTTPEGQAALAASILEIEPLDLTPEEEAEWAAARAEVKRYTIEAVKRQMGL